MGTMSDIPDRDHVAADAQRVGALLRAVEAPAPADLKRRIVERNAAKKARDFARSDAIRKELADAGIVVEDTKDGTRWKRK